MCFPGALQPITSQNLQAVSNSPAGSTALYYSIEQAPRLGRLSTSRGEEIRNFTQAQVSFHLLQPLRSPRHSPPSPSAAGQGSQPDPAATAGRGARSLAGGRTRLQPRHDFPCSAIGC